MNRPPAPGCRSTDAPPPGPPLPGDDDWRLVLRDRLLERRVVVVSGTLDGPAAGQAAMELMTLDGSGDGPVTLRIDAADGDLDAAMSLMDVVDLAGVPVRVTCTGLVGGPAVGVVAVGHRRAALPHAGFRLSPATGRASGRATDLERWARERHERWQRYCERVAAALGRDAGQTAELLSSGRTLDVGAALDLGLVDEVVGRTAAVHRLPGPPMGFRPR